MDKRANILVIEHLPPGRGGQFDHCLERNKVHFDIVRMSDDVPLPAFRQYDGVISGGGFIGVYETEKPEHAFLKQEQEFLLHAIERDVPVLGVCLGHQLLADAFGGHVAPTNMFEYGWLDITLTSEGLKDPLFAGVERQFYTFLYHGDVVRMPPNGVIVLAFSSACPYQAFRYIGKQVWSVQFHPEFSPSRAEALLSFTRETLKLKGVDVDGMIPRGYKVFGEANRRIFENFIRIIRES